MFTTTEVPLENFKFSQSKNIQCSHLSPAIDNTFVYLLFQKLKQKVTVANLIYCDSKGEVLSKYILSWKLGSFKSYHPFLSTFSGDKVIVTEFSSNKLTQIDLKTRKIVQCRHKFNNLIPVAISIHMFSETNILCIEETVSQQAQFRLKLRYYQLPLVKGTESIADYQINVDYQINFSQRQWFGVSKANNHSMIIWYNLFCDVRLVLNIIRLQKLTEEDKYKLQEQTMEFDSFRPYGVKSISISDVWENEKKGQILIACEFISQENQRENKIVKVSIDTQYGYISWETFSFPFQSFTDSNLLQCLNLGQFCVINLITKSDSKQKIRHSMCLHNQTKQLIEIDRKKDEGSLYSTEYFISNTNPSQLCNIVYKKKQNSYYHPISMRVTSFFNCFQVTLYFLLGLNEDFDDDLLKDAIERIDFVNQSDEYKQGYMEQWQSSQEKSERKM